MQNPNGSLKTRLRQARIASTSASVRHPAALPHFQAAPSAHDCPAPRQPHSPPPKAA
ncbi:MULTISPECIES: hypothetical protein [Kingella]|uniref:Uncharacterized protein n=1 Tax=Kingella bonacorsii TaxID=2796361 RepID=A0ABS1BVM8_9NEIS|nr:hypothetical protein [Kingella bonacorsii]MBK0397213.1 hypothetical protein [Kingella bonacorsii]